MEFKSAVPSMLRVMLLKREVLPVPVGFERLRVRSGQAWVTLGGRDLALQRGEEVELESKVDRAVVSTLGELPLVVELEPAATAPSRMRPRRRETAA